MRGAFALALIFSSAAPLVATEWPGFRRNLIILRLEGHIALDPKSVPTGGPVVVSMSVDHADRWLVVDGAITEGDDQPLSGRAVLNMLAPLQPNLIVVGAKELRERLAGVPAGGFVRMEGLVDRGSRTFLLRDVQVGTEPRT